ncbi:DNA recombination protein RmuC [Taibaiella soli]|uniref:DNA recombination protein RmuC n=1 Tax=Taibaiella soli TaxID=1649169 RepID=A0A2W2BWR2_9BACT|nr:DNA recombination protein RmuC [Taibaiella soli]PZF72293.1 DNA recombination protein RmuC [Taibaiella soli]
MIGYGLIVAALMIGILLGWIIARSMQSKNVVNAAAVDEIRQQLKDTQQSKDAITGQLQEANKTIAKLDAMLDFKQEKLETQAQEIENIGQRFEAQFKILANNILEEKAERFAQQQESSLKIILDPLKENIQNFKQEFESKIKTESDERISLREQIKQMVGLNQTLSEQANSLTQALRGNVKQQGNWGEMILERILEHTGLQKNVHYFVQERSQNDSGQIIQPDVVIKYPDQRVIIIDAKVSLVHYESYIQSKNETEQQQNLTLMIRSVKAHIDGLSAKSYHEFNNALDFVMMFVPVEAAYITVMQAEPDLWQYAYHKRVLLISPTNLIAAMKLVNDLWQRDGVNKNAQNIADRAVKIYEKLVSFVDNFEKVGTQIDRAHDVWQDAFKQLSRGKGNLISQAEQMKQLRLNTQKKLPTTIVEQAMMEDEASSSSSEGGELPTHASA